MTLGSIVLNGIRAVRIETSRKTQKRPAIVGGKRKLVEVPLVWAFDRYNNSITTFRFTNMFDKAFYIMKFDEAGEPIWDAPAKKE